MLIGSAVCEVNELTDQATRRQATRRSIKQVRNLCVQSFFVLGEWIGKSFDCFLYKHQKGSFQDNRFEPIFESIFVSKRKNNDSSIFLFNLSISQAQPRRFHLQTNEGRKLVEHFLLPRELVNIELAASKRWSQRECQTMFHCCSMLLWPGLASCPLGAVATFSNKANSITIHHHDDGYDWCDGCDEGNMARMVALFRWQWRRGTSDGDASSQNTAPMVNKNKRIAFAV